MWIEWHANDIHPRQNEKGLDRLRDQSPVVVKLLEKGLDGLRDRSPVAIN